MTAVQRQTDVMRRVTLSLVVNDSFIVQVKMIRT